MALAHLASSLSLASIASALDRVGAAATAAGAAAAAATVEAVETADGGRSAVLIKSQQNEDIRNRKGKKTSFHVPGEEKRGKARGNDDVMHVNGRNEQKKKRTAVKKCIAPEIGSVRKERKKMGRALSMKMVRKER
uniref:Ribosomal protein n=1 Tax=Pristionchus pacificus TaxID=54126 RepID=A0A2A6CTG8_PRIPA|eukprot:PDM81347.1 hypothetical protein PRIPAC_35223 [Pristionchus pacificus]